MSRWVGFASHQAWKIPKLTLSAPSVDSASTRHILPFQRASEGLPSSGKRTCMSRLTSPLWVTSNPALLLVLRPAHLVWLA